MGAANRPRTSWAARCLASSSGSMEPGVLTEWMAFSARIMGARRRSSFSGFSALAIFSGLAAFSWRLSCFFSLAVRRMVCFFSSMVRLPSPAEGRTCQIFYTIPCLWEKGNRPPLPFSPNFWHRQEVVRNIFPVARSFPCKPPRPLLYYTLSTVPSLRPGPSGPVNDHR